MRVLNGVAEVRAAVGQHLGFSDYQVVDQPDVDAFAELTGDHQWIHVDVERARGGPFGGTIAHGLFTLALGPRLASSVYRIDGMTMGVNYGYDKIRFPAPVPVGSKVRLGVQLIALTDLPGGVQLTLKFTWEVEGRAKPACVAEMLLRYSAASS
jgi:acyl dehydratase